MKGSQAVPGQEVRATGPATKDTWHQIFCRSAIFCKCQPWMNKLQTAVVLWGDTN